MAGSGSLTLSGTFTGLPSGTRTISLTYTIAAAIDDAVPVTLSVGNNTIAVPSGANGVVIEPPPSNTVLVLLKGVNGDTGVALHKTFGTIYFLDASQVNFVLNAASALPGPVQLTFF